MSAPESVSDPATALVGVDVGGTHTDAVVAFQGRFTHGKSPTTRHDYSQGIVDAIGVAAQDLGMDAPHLLRQTRRFINSTTIVTNALTELRGAKIGILITRGFKDTFRLARSPRNEILDDHAQTNVADITPRDCIVEVAERVAPDGEVRTQTGSERGAPLYES